MAHLGKPLFWAGIALGLGLTLWLLAPVLSPFVAGAAVAYLLRPVCGALGRRGMSQAGAAALVIGGFFVLVTMAIVALAPLLWTQASDLAMSLPGVATRIAVTAQERWETFRGQIGDESFAKLQDATSSALRWGADGMASVLRHAIAGGVAVIDLATLAIVAPVVSYYLLAEHDRIVAWVDAHMPPAAAPTIRAHFVAIDRTLSAWVRGQSTVCLLLAAFYSVALTACGLRWGLAIGLMTGAFAFVPFVGFAAGAAAAAAACAMTYGSWEGWVAVAVVFAVGQILEGWILVPKLVGRSVGLHELWVMFALMAGHQLFGFLGVLLAVPGAAVAGIIAGSALARYRSSRFFADVGLVAAPAMAEGKRSNRKRR